MPTSTPSWVCRRSIPRPRSMERLEEIHPEDRRSRQPRRGRGGDSAQGDLRSGVPRQAPRRCRSVGCAIKAASFAGDNGQPNFLAGLTLDITERKKAEEAQTLLIQELNHRVKNMLTTVQAIALQSLNGQRRRGEGTLSIAYSRAGDVPQPAHARRVGRARSCAISSTARSRRTTTSRRRAHLAVGRRTRCCRRAMRCR